ncbi:MAG: hypothetical protein ACOYMS_01425 [Terrimicrobiaceae bacterium]
MKIFLVPVLLLGAVSVVVGQNQAATPPQASPVFEPSPILDASAILQPAYLQGPNFRVRNPVPTYGGANAYEIDSDFGVFPADGNAMLMRRVAEINAIAILNGISKTDEFKQAALKAAQSPLVVAKELVTNPVGTISGVPRGIWKFLNQAGQSVKELGEGRKPDPVDGNVAQNLLGFSKVKRKISLDLGVDPYSTNEVYQEALNQVAWPAFAGGFTVNIGTAVATAGIGTAGRALTAVNWTGNFNDILRENSPADLRLMNLGLLLNMGVSRPDAVAFLNNNAISPTAQTILVGSLALLGQAKGREYFIQQATVSADEHDALFYQQCAQLMALVNASAPISAITLVNGLPLCLAAGGAVVVPLQWDYVAWTPMAAKFANTVKGLNLGTPPVSYNLVISGVVSPMAADELAKLGIGISQKQLLNPLK